MCNPSESATTVTTWKRQKQRRTVWNCILPLCQSSLPMLLKWPFVLTLSVELGLVLARERRGGGVG